MITRRLKEKQEQIAKREAELAEFRRKAYFDLHAAAERNKKQVLKIDEK